MSDKDSVTIYYNSACPVCEAGVRSERRRCGSDSIQWVDVHRRNEPAREAGVTLEDVRRRLHLRDSQGRMFVGSEAIAQLWSRLPSRRWASRLMRLPGVRILASASYEAFSKALYVWNLRQRNWMPELAATPPNADAGELARFSALASRWWDPESEFRPLHQINPLRLAWIDSLAPLAGRRVLDVGCGGGILAEAMADTGAHVVGIDLAEAPLAVAELHARQHGATVQYQAISAEELSRARQADFDVVTCMEMLEHVPRPAETVAACARLARPGGWVFFSTINRTPLSYAFAILGAEYILRLLPRGTHQWRRFIQPGELVRMASAHRLVLNDTRGLGYNPFTRRFWLHRRTGVGYLLAFRAPH